MHWLATRVAGSLRLGLGCPEFSFASLARWLPHVTAKPNSGPRPLPRGRRGLLRNETAQGEGSSHSAMGFFRVRHALAILTCVPQGAIESLRRRLPEALRTLETSGYDGSVAIVDDASSDAEHLRELDRLERRYHVIRRESNGGISRAKNTCLRVLLEAGINVAFLAEDDVEFYSGWHEQYLAAHQATGIQHFSWASDTYLRSMRKFPREVNGHPIVQTSRLNGALLTVTPPVIHRVGGFRVMPAPWGHEHIHWTNRIVKAGLAPFYCDISDSNRYIGLNRFSCSSAFTPSQKADYSRKNQEAAADRSQVYWPLQE